MKNKIAAIDIGTNSFHLIIASVNRNNKIEILEKSREVLRLNFTSNENIIPAGTIEKAIAILKNFKAIANKHNAIIKAVATSAVRESKNKNDFIKKIYEATKIKINVIKGKEEARLIYLGIQNALNLKDKKILCIDIGGGSTEIIIGENNKIKFSESIKLGAVRLTEMFSLKNYIHKKNIEKCEQHILRELEKIIPVIHKYKIDFVIGSSGTIVNIALISEAMKGNNTTKEKLNGRTYKFDDLQKVKELIFQNKSLPERKTIKGLEKKRADIITAGVILLSLLLKYFNIKGLTISTSALREGIVVDYKNSFTKQYL